MADHFSGVVGGVTGEWRVTRVDGGRQCFIATRTRTKQWQMGTGWWLDDEDEDDRPQYEDNLIIDNQLWEFKWTL